MFASNCGSREISWKKELKSKLVEVGIDLYSIAFDGCPMAHLVHVFFCTRRFSSGTKGLYGNSCRCLWVGGRVCASVMRESVWTMKFYVFYVHFHVVAVKLTK